MNGSGPEYIPDLLLLYDPSWLLKGQHWSAELIPSMEKMCLVTMLHSSATDFLMIWNTSHYYQSESESEIIYWSPRGNYSNQCFLLLLLIKASVHVHPGENSHTADTYTHLYDTWLWIPLCDVIDCFLSCWCLKGQKPLELGQRDHD